MSFTTLSETNSYFNLVYTLTTQQINDTITANPGGFYYLRDATGGINLGNNTINQTDYGNINIGITNGNQLVFNNRFVPSTGSKNLEIHFNVGPPSYGDDIIQSITYNSTLLSQPYYAQNNLNNSQISLTETTSKFNAIYELSTQQLNSTIVAYPSGFYYLRDATANINIRLGDNTINQIDYKVYVTNTNQLVFNNRFVPSTGIKTLNIIFNNGSNDTLVPDTNLIYNAEILERNVPCFKSDTKILTDKGYIAIQYLRKGDLVKTVNHEFKPIDMIGEKEIYHSALQERVKEQLYKCSKTEYPEVFEPLVITGCHSILVNSFANAEQREKTIEVTGDTYVTDRKYRLPACADHRASVYEIVGTYTIYHFALEHDDYYMNYGVYANGLLVETCSKRYLKELSNMTLLE